MKQLENRPPATPKPSHASDVSLAKDDRHRFRQLAEGGDRVVEPRSWREFVETPPTKGLGATRKLVRRLVGGDQKALDLITKAEQGQQGRRSDLVYNVQEVKAPTGNTPEAALRRLRKDRPDLHARVIAGELSPHAAAIRGGYRKWQAFHFR